MLISRLKESCGNDLSYCNCRCLRECLFVACNCTYARHPTFFPIFFAEHFKCGKLAGQQSHMASKQEVLEIPSTVNNPTRNIVP